MKQVHSTWPLFIDDLQFAQNWMRNQLSRFPMSAEVGHTALNIGLRGEVEKYLASKPRDNRVKQSIEDQFRFRLARMDGEKNPYRELIPRCHHDNVYRFVAEAANRKTPLTVRLFGGLGDQLELLSLVVPWGRRHNVPLRLMAEEKCCRLLKPLLPEHVRIERFNPDECSPLAQSMAIRLGIFQHDPSSCFTSWIQTEMCTRDPNLMVCCWRAEGHRNPLSAHSRSVPFPLVHSLYLRLMEREPQTKIVDITTWQPWEMRRFQEIGVTIQNPITLGLKGLVNLCQGRRVLSIDTALIHLCVAMGHAAELLLPYFPDERWVELSRSQHNYGQQLKIYRSTQFGSWAKLIDSIN